MDEQGRSLEELISTSKPMKERELINIVSSQNPKDKISSLVHPSLIDGKLSWILTVIVRDRGYTLCSARSDSPRLFKQSNTCLRYIVDNFEMTNDVEILVTRDHVLALLGADNLSVPVTVSNDGLDIFSKPLLVSDEFITGQANA